MFFCSVDLPCGGALYGGNSKHILKKEGGGILFEDNAIIAINKPSGLLVLPGRFDRGERNLYAILKDVFGTIYVIHRIDCDTSGTILFAKIPEAHHVLDVAF